jgi:hypothetical protein
LAQVEIISDNQFYAVSTAEMELPMDNQFSDSAGHVKLVSAL